MKLKLFKVLFFLVALFSANIIIGQSITGKVTDGNFPLPGVNVVIKGSTIGVVTDFDGIYKISGVKTGETLVFSSIGFVNKEIIVNRNTTTINVTLDQDVESLNEVVVVGYGTQSRTKVSGAITSVNGEELNRNVVIGVDQALQGRAAGVTVQSGGSPGQAPTVRIRGLSTFGGGDPLYVVDGIFVTDLNTINPSSIEKVDILKDAAAAAIYGSRGSNGVILITTKKGKNGWSKIGVNSYTGFQTFDKRYDLLNSQEYRQYAESLGALPPRLTETKYAEDVSRNDTDWQNEIFETAPMRNIDANYSGGSDKINYYMYGGYLQQEGVIINTGFDRYTFGINSDLKISDKIKIGETLGVGITDQAQLNESGGRTLIEHTIKQSPLLGVYEPGTLNFQGPANRVDLNDAENPVRVQSLQERINRNSNLYGSLYGEYEFLKGLKFRQQASVNINYNNNDYISRRYSDGDYSAEPEFTEPSHSQAVNRLTKSQQRFLATTLTSSLSYNVTLAEKHNLDATAVFEKFETLRERQIADGTAADNLDEFTKTQAVTESITEEDILVSYIGRVNYSFDNKYILSASIRRDGSSRFGRNFIWGNFPAASAAWRISQENFFEDIDIVNELKIRASYGVTGNNQIPLYGFQSSIRPFGSYIIGSGDNLINNNVFSGVTNEDLRWEKSTKTNIGFDLGLLNNKITLAAEYFTSDGKDLLIGDITPPSFGVPNIGAGEDLTFINSNLADVKTSGFEFQIGYNDKIGDFKWSIDANLSTTKNEVLTAGSVGEKELQRSVFEGETINIIRVGDPILSFFGWQTDGIFQNDTEIAAAATHATATSPGDIRFKDLDGDNKIGDGDRTIIGNPFPDFTYGFNLNASYKGFDIVANLYGVQGVDVFNSNLYDIEGSVSLFNAGKTVLNAWTPENTNTSQPRVVNGDPNRNVRFSDRYIEDGSFLRIKNITLGYSLSDKILKESTKGIVSKFRVYLQGLNVYTFTDYSGYDPEVPARRENFIQNTGPISELGVDRGFYPTPKSFLMGVQVEF